jgi:hypothetical protein
MAAQLKELLPSLQHVLADVLHVMKRVFETLPHRHPKIGEGALLNSAASRHARWTTLCQGGYQT